LVTKYISPRKAVPQQPPQVHNHFEKPRFTCPALNVPRRQMSSINSRSSVISSGHRRLGRAIYSWNGNEEMALRSFPTNHPLATVEWPKEEGKDIFPLTLYTQDAPSWRGSGQHYTTYAALDSSQRRPTVNSTFSVGLA
jgi:hypothetical protein